MRYPGEIAREQYDDHPGVRWSRLSNMRRSPLHYLHGLKNHRPETTALRTGSALHTLVFEPETYEDRFTVYRESKTKGTGAKTNWEAFQLKNAHLTILDAIEEERALGCAAAIRQTPACEYIGPGLGCAEIPITWTDEKTGLLCKARLDWVTNGGLVLDLKSTRSAEIRAFGRQAWHLGYFHQAVFYSMGFAAVTGQKLEDIPFLFIPVESDAPHDVSLFEPCEETRYAALEEVRALLDRLAECERTNYWPGRYEGKQILKAPAYVLMSDDEDWDVKTTGESTDGTL